MFARENGAEKVIADVLAIHELIAKEHPGLPVIVFGHSMGGLIALNFVQCHGRRVAGAAVWNANFSAGLSERLARLLLLWERFRLGSDVPSRLLPKLTFQAWARQIPNRRTEFVWLSRDPASCRAGHTCQRLVTSVVKRIAWSTLPSRTSRQRSSPGRIGSPAASVDVQPSGRSRLDPSDQVAPEPADQRPSDSVVLHVS